MTRVTRAILLLAIFTATTFFERAAAQNVLDPNDPIVNYDPANRPTPPGWMQIGKWVRTPNTAVNNRNNGWTGLSRYKAYVFQNISFRLMYPKSYNPNANDGKKYPLILFLHGKGENAKAPLYDASTGLNYDNEFQLLQGPREFDVANQNGTYDGYVLVPQITDAFYQGILDNLMLVIKYMIANNKVDPFRIVVNGLSEGGIASWETLAAYPTIVSSSIPMSSPTGPITYSVATNPNYINTIKYSPIWMSHGLTDNNPSPTQVNELRNILTNAGANFRLLTIPNTGHSTWYQMWGQADFWPTVNRSYSSNPYMLYSPRYFWPGQAISGTVGIAPGFEEYQWRRNGVVIPGQTGNSIEVSLSGTYDARVKRDGVWSDWSYVPVRVRPGFYEAENYVAMNGVQTEATQDAGGGQHVGWINWKEWMDYTVHPNVAGTFSLQLRVSSTLNGGTIQVRGQDSSVLATVSVPNTGSWNTFTTVTTNVTLPAGTQNIRLQSTSVNGWNLNWLQFGLIAAGPLPVQFTYFNASCSGNDVSLQWRTATEQDSRDFTIQRSTDGVNWTSVGVVPAAGQSNTERTYNFTDRNAVRDARYRLLQTDLDGSSTLSSIVRANCGTTGVMVSLYPNPSSDNTTLSVRLDRSRKVSITVVDSKGSVVRRSDVVLPAGTSNVPLLLSSFSKGVYTVDVRYDEERTSLKLIKK